MKLKNAFLALALVGLTACEVQPSPVSDQCLRAELFAKCMASLPPGPEMPHYNDWDEVVASCDNASYYQSKREVSAIKPECMGY